MPRAFPKPLFRLAVEGDSMRPAFEPGDRLVVLGVGRIRVGDAVAVRDPRDPRRTIVKRVVRLDGGGEGVWVEGDNGERSTDSRHFGPVPRGAVRGRVVYRYAPPARAGRVTRTERARRRA